MRTLGIQLNRDTIDGINEELAYTETLHEKGRADGIDYGTEGQLLTLKVYTDKAIAAWVNNPSPEQALHELRKVAAIAARALIRDGCPRRVR